MRLLSILTFFQLLAFTVEGQITANSQWTWVKGDSIESQYGIYGVLGTGDVLNMPGARSSCASWKDTDGNFWLFGGYGYGASGNRGYLDDIWKYNPTTNVWTWVKGDNTSSTFTMGVYGTKGVPNSINTPGGRYASACWVDNNGKFWLFGGGGFGHLDDLWKYDPLINQWTWINGNKSFGYWYGVYGIQNIATPTNVPGGRNNSCSWVDNNGNFWLFGGVGAAADCSDCLLDDLWRYDVGSKQWTWINGDSTGGQSGSYGTKGVETASNKPGARYGGVSWKDSNNNLWLFGGTGYDSGNSTFYLNDLWKYSITDNQWTWIDGDNIAGQGGVYGTKGISSVNNKPGAREYSTSWTDDSGNFWLYGGVGELTRSNDGGQGLNDLWKYNPSENSWSWVNGDSTLTIFGRFDTQGVSDAKTQPGSRGSSDSWTDSSDDLWLFGGDYYSGPINDLWKLSPIGPTIWTGAVNNSWENPGNWSSGKIPDSSTDVIINSGSVILSANGICKSIHIDGSASLIVSSGYTLEIIK